MPAGVGYGKMSRAKFSSCVNKVSKKKGVRNGRKGASAICMATAKGTRKGKSR